MGLHVLAFRQNCSASQVHVHALLHTGTSVIKTQGTHFLLVTGLAQAVPSRLFLVTVKNFAFFFVPGLSQANPISNRSKTVEHWSGGGG